jgi:hypothetical protein
MPRVGSELMIPVFKRAKRFHALDRAAAVIGLISEEFSFLGYNGV